MLTIILILEFMPVWTNIVSQFYSFNPVETLIPA